MTSIVWGLWAYAMGLWPWACLGEHSAYCYSVSVTNQYNPNMAKSKTKSLDLSDPSGFLTKTRPIALTIVDYTIVYRLVYSR